MEKMVPTVPGINTVTMASAILVMIHIALVEGKVILVPQHFNVRPVRRRQNQKQVMFAHGAPEALMECVHGVILFMDIMEKLVVCFMIHVQKGWIVY